MMHRILRASLVIAVVFASPVVAQADRDAECALQGDLFRLIQQARLDGVRVGQVPAAVAEARPQYSEKLLATVPQLANYVYAEFTKRQLRNLDLGEQTRQQCVANWDQIQAMRDAVQN
ncbi:MAG: hypothetical protein AAF943_13005 [Pseudomonadota bacterium]